MNNRWGEFNLYFIKNAMRNVGSGICIQKGIEMWKIPNIADIINQY